MIQMMVMNKERRGEIEEAVKWGRRGEEERQIDVGKDRVARYRAVDSKKELGEKGRARVGIRMLFFFFQAEDGIRDSP